MSQPSSQTMTPDELRMQEIREVMSKIPEGRALLAAADKQNLKIELYDMPPGMGAYFGTREDGQTVVRIDRTSPLADQIGAAFHELRHAEQFEITGRRFHAWNPRFADPQTELLQLKVIEADAYTFQYITAMKLKEAGHPEVLQHLQDISREDSSAFKAVMNVLDKRPPSSFPDESSMQRAIFTAVFAQGLPEYNQAFFSKLHATLDSYAPDELQMLAERTRNAGPLLDNDKLQDITKIDGKSYLSGVSLTALRPGVEGFFTAPEREMMASAVELSRMKEEPTAQQYAEIKSKYADNFMNAYAPPSAAAPPAAAASKFATAPQQTQPPVASLQSQLESDPILPKNVTVNGAKMPLVEALRDDGFRKEFVQKLQTIDAKGQVDLKGQIAKIEAFGKMPDVAAAARLPAQAAPARRSQSLGM